MRLNKAILDEEAEAACSTSCNCTGTWGGGRCGGEGGRVKEEEEEERRKSRRRGGGVEEKVEGGGGVVGEGMEEWRRRRSGWVEKEQWVEEGTRSCIIRSRGAEEQG